MKDPVPVDNIPCPKCKGVFGYSFSARTIDPGTLGHGLLNVSERKFHYFKEGKTQDKPPKFARCLSCSFIVTFTGKGWSRPKQHIERAFREARTNLRARHAIQICTPSHRAPGPERQSP